MSVAVGYLLARRAGDSTRELPVGLEVFGELEASAASSA